MGKPPKKLELLNFLPLFSILDKMPFSVSISCQPVVLFNWFDCGLQLDIGKGVNI